MSILLQNTTPENVLQGFQICTLPNIKIEKKVMFKMLSSEIARINMFNTRPVKTNFKFAVSVVHIIARSLRSVSS